MTDTLVQNISGLLSDVQRVARQAHAQYSPEVDTVIHEQCLNANRIEQLLDGILDFCFDPEMLRLYKKTKENKDAESRKALQKKLKGYLKQMEKKKAAESRQLLKERFDYPIFMYEAEKVGISATGEEDQNELYPNANQPEGTEKTCLEWYRDFLTDPEGFIGEE